MSVKIVLVVLAVILSFVTFCFGFRKGRQSKTIPLDILNFQTIKGIGMVRESSILSILRHHDIYTVEEFCEHVESIKEAGILDEYDLESIKKYVRSVRHACSNEGVRVFKLDKTRSLDKNDDSGLYGHDPGAFMAPKEPQNETQE